MDKDEAKKILLTMILENKNVLFGAFSSQIDNVKKQALWKKIHMKGINIKYFKNDSSVDKVKSFWQQEKSKYFVSLQNNYFSKFTHFYGTFVICLSDFSSRTLDVSSTKLDLVDL